MTDRVLNLYAGIGGNRKLWDDVDVVAVEWNESIAQVYQDYFPDDEVIIADAHEFLRDHYDEGWDFIWASPPCQTHSRLSAMAWQDDSSQNATRSPKYPDMKLYQEIIFLDRFFDGDWFVENVVSHYEPLIEPKQVGRHYTWSNFNVRKKEFEPSMVDEGGRIEIWEEKYGYDLSDYTLTHRKDQVLKNCVDPALGEYVMEERRSQSGSGADVTW